MISLSAIAHQISQNVAPASRAPVKAAGASEPIPMSDKGVSHKTSVATAGGSARAIPISETDPGDTGIPVFLRRKPGEKIPYAGKEPKAAPKLAIVPTTATEKATENTMAKKNLKKKPSKKAKKAAKATKPANGNGKSKTEIVAAMLLRKDGCTSAEILAATKWPSVSVPGQAKANGLTLRKEKVAGEPTRYFGSVAQ